MNFMSDRKFDLICLGRVGADMNPSEFNKPMEDVRCYTISIGGSPANIAVGVAKLGLKVGFIGKVSDDSMGRYVTSQLQRYGIDTSQIGKAKNALTSLAITEVISADNCPVVFYRDNVADLLLRCEDVSEEYIANSKALLISGTALSKSPSREAAYMAVEYARKHNTIVIFEIDYRSYTWLFQDETSYCYNKLCEQSDIIIGTREEFNAVEYRYDKENRDDLVSAERWFRYKAKIVLVKRGSEGFKVFLNDGKRYIGRTYPAVIRKTFGAGDALASSFIASLIKGRTMEEAIDYGSISAAISISLTDCSESLPTENEILDFKKKYQQSE